jgi:hypothetical protein
MKKIIFYFSLFLLCTVSAMAQNKHAKADVWIDRFDFEGYGLRSSNQNTLRGETWKSFSDNDINGVSSITRNYSIPDKEHGKVLELNYTLTQGEAKYAPYVGVYCNLQASTYPEHIVYIAYDYKGSQHALQYCTNDVKDFNYYKKDIPASEQWTTVLVPVSELQQTSGSGTKVPLNMKELNALSWLIQGKTGDTGSLMIDNIRFVYTPIEGKNYAE